MCNSNYKASKWFICAGETLTKQGVKNGMWQILETLPELSKPAAKEALENTFPSASITRWQRGKKKSFGTCSEKSLSFPEGNLSVWGILAAALHLHSRHREGAAGGATPLPHASQLPLACCFRSGDQNMYSCLVLTSLDARVISRVCRLLLHSLLSFHTAAQAYTSHGLQRFSQEQVPGQSCWRKFDQEPCSFF